MVSSLSLSLSLSAKGSLELRMLKASILDYAEEYMTQTGIERRPSQSPGWHSNRKATKLVVNKLNNE